MSKERPRAMNHSCVNGVPLALRTLLLISADSALYQELRTLANKKFGHIVVRVLHPEGVLPAFWAIKPAAVLLDLDFPQQQAWPMAELLLQQQTIPLILLTGQTCQFDLRTALRPGSPLDKNDQPSKILQAVEEALELPRHHHTERNAMQQVLLRWLKPSDSSSNGAPTYRFWGINE